MNDTTPYAASHIRERLAEDPRVAELGIVVDVRADQVFLRGQVETAERRDRVGALVAELAPSWHVHNELSVTGTRRPDGSEDVS